MRKSIVMLGATGAAGNHAALTLASSRRAARLSLLRRRPAANVVGDAASQHAIDILEPSSYERHLEGHRTAICALGVGQPSKMSREEFARIDHDAVLDLARACTRVDIAHLALLTSVGVDATSASFYLRTKGEPQEAVKALE